MRPQNPRPEAHGGLHGWSPTGANVKAVRRMLDHSTASQTLDRFSHLFTRDLKALATASIWCFVNNTRPQSSEDVFELVV